MRHSNQYSKKEKAAAVLLFCTNLVIFLTRWLVHTYDRINFDQILFQFKSSSTGVYSAISGSAVWQVGVYSVVVTLVELALYPVLSGRRDLKYRRKNVQADVKAGAEASRSDVFSAFLRKHALSLASVVLIAAIAICGARIHFYRFVKTETTGSAFIPGHYIKPDSSILHFPEKKRNLIYLFLESMESTYADPSAGDKITDCYIPELKELAEQNLNFSNTDGLGGALSFPGTTWTAAAMVAQTSGVAVKISLESDSYGAGDEFLPGATSIGEILEKQGYQQELLLGSNAEFHGRETYFTEHGNYQILDTDALKAAHRLPMDYDQWWGFEDEKLFGYAREELTRLSQEDAPFNLTMLTADTHFPDGYVCELCRNDYEIQYANVLACSSRQVADFVAWIQEQPFYENTTIVISGDHLTMDAGFMENADPEYTRTVYDCFIHSAVEPLQEKNRQFGTFDLFPTTLAALGVEIDGNRLGLGTNLFSNRRTLTEQYGYEFLAEELQKQSDFYDEQVLQKQSES